MNIDRHVIGSCPQWRKYGLALFIALSVVSLCAFSCDGKRRGNNSRPGGGGGDSRGTPIAARVLIPDPIYGVTIDRVEPLDEVVKSLKDLKSVRKPTTRVIFDAGQGPDDYSDAVRAIQKESYVMGMLSDSSAMWPYNRFHTPTEDYRQRAEAYATQLGPYVDIWELGNELNGEWVGWQEGEWERRSDPELEEMRRTVAQQVVDAFNVVTNNEAVKARGGKTSLTFYYNDDNLDGGEPVTCRPYGARHRCWPDRCVDGVNVGREYEMFHWIDTYLTDPSLRAGVNYAFVSFYEDDCTTLDKDPDTWVKIFRKLSERFPNAKVGFGEFGPQCHMCAETRVCPQCLGQQPEYIRRYYRTWHSRIRSQVPNYTGGFFYWYYWQDMVPKSKPAQKALKDAIRD